MPPKSVCVVHAGTVLCFLDSWSFSVLFYDFLLQTSKAALKVFSLARIEVQAPCPAASSLIQKLYFGDAEAKASWKGQSGRAPAGYVTHLLSLNL
jgi:hypothetical protein